MNDSVYIKYGDCYYDFYLDDSEQYLIENEQQTSGDSRKPGQNIYDMINEYFDGLHPDYIFGDFEEISKAEYEKWLKGVEA